MIKLLDEELKRIIDYIKKNYGIDLQDKRTFIESRLSYEVTSLSYKSFNEFINVAVNDPKSKEHTLLIDKLTTNHTFFMRENNHFEYLKNKILPQLELAIRDRDLRIWSAGCSSGEEPYNIAMILSDYFGNNSILWDTRILATDISSEILEKAIKGKYTKEAVDTLPRSWVLMYFDEINKNEYQLKESIRSMVIYRKFNLMTDQYPFKKKFHVIFCRNVMIYFDADTRKRIIQKFYDKLEVGGYLIIGHSETFPKDWAKFEYISTSIYRKVE